MHIQKRDFLRGENWMCKHELCVVSGDVSSGEERVGEVRGESGEGGGEGLEESSDTSKVWEGDPGGPKLSTM